MSEPAGLRVEHLVKHYGAVRAVNDISFTAAPGELVALLGPSGCGKTTTLRCIAGFEHPEQGRITLDGVAITDADTGVFTAPNRRRFGMVFQSYAVWPHMTVFDNVAYPLVVQGGVSKAQIRERVAAKLAMVGLAGLEGRYPANLSGGQQQRVALARAIVMDPKALLFDEPLSNLDAKLRERMRFELIDIQRQLAVPAVYVTHDQTEAMVMSRTVIVMQDGRIAQAGAPEEIYERPSSRFVADFVGNCNFIEAEAVSIDGNSVQVRSSLGTLVCASADSPAPGSRVLVAIRPEWIVLDRTPLGRANGFAAVVQQRYFLGHACEYVLQAGDVTLRAHATTSMKFKAGEQVHAHVAPEHCKLIRESTK